MNFMDKLKNSFRSFMTGRYGIDDLNKFFLVLCPVFLILSAVFKQETAKMLCSILAIMAIVLIYFRMFSKNRSKRYEENRKYVRIKYRIFGKLKGIKERWVQRKEYKFFTCPSCHATLRVPKGHGKIKIVCRKCGNSFIGKS